MVNVLNPKVQASGLIDIALLGVSKKATEQVMIPIVGNGTIKSGVVKLAIGGILQGQMGKVGKTVGGGMVVDGVEDIIVSFMGDTIGTGDGTGNNEWA